MIPMRTTLQQPTTPQSRRVRGKGGDAQSLLTGRAMARAWSQQVDERRRQQAAWSFITETIRSYVAAQGEGVGTTPKVSPPSLALTFELDEAAAQLAQTLGRSAAQLPLEEACYLLSATYTALLPTSVRAAWGAYYTPSALTSRLLDLATEGGVDWRSARVLDPACGGGAFLLPVALRMRAALPKLKPTALLRHLADHLCGFEIDPFAAWLTQVWLEIAFAAELRSAQTAFPVVVTVCDSLDQVPDPGAAAFDLVVGNPPYGRVSLTPVQRACYKRSLYGHANLYGVFTDLAVRWAKPGGVIAYVTPTSFLAGEYFKALRSLLTAEAPPIAIDFISTRKGVFEDVLQEAALTTYRRGGTAGGATVHFLTVTSPTVAEVTQAGRFELPARAGDPWLAPREPSAQALVDRLVGMPTRLATWGYGVSTGPLVWNRFKDQLRLRGGADTFPLIWAEAVTSDGRFVFRAEKKNHQPYFRALPPDGWLQVRTPCVLLQRTTAKEQVRRLIAAELPASFIAQHKAVVVENHLNMVRPIINEPKVSPAALAAVLNSEVTDRAFRCISGSVAVSAFELEALPLPSVRQMQKIETLVRQKATPARINAELQRIYLGKVA